MACRGRDNYATCHMLGAMDMFLILDVDHSYTDIVKC